MQWSPRLHAGKVTPSRKQLQTTSLTSTLVRSPVGRLLLLTWARGLHLPRLWRWLLGRGRAAGFSGRALRSCGGLWTLLSRSCSPILAAQRCPCPPDIPCQARPDIAYGRLRRGSLTPSARIPVLICTGLTLTLTGSDPLSTPSAIVVLLRPLDRSRPLASTASHAGAGCDLQDLDAVVC